MVRTISENDLNHVTNSMKRRDFDVYTREAFEKITTVTDNRKQLVYEFKRVVGGGLQPEYARTYSFEGFAIHPRVADANDNDT